MKSIRKRFAIGVVVLALVLSAVPAFSYKVYGKAPNRTIKVGFFAYPGYHEINDGVRGGYGYDFLILLQRYTDLNFEFVGYENSWEEMQQMLLDGEIDLVTSARKNKEREKIFDFSEPIGTNTAQINVRATDTRYNPGDYYALNGIMIGELAGNSRNADVEEFAKEKGFVYRVREYNTADELHDALINKEVDAIATSSLRKYTGEKTVAEFAEQEFYCIVKKGDTDLLDQVDYGITQMDYCEGNWRDDLFYKNYRAVNSNLLTFSIKELQYINDVQTGRKTITVTSHPDLDPYSFVENGELKGIIPDYFAHLMESAGLRYTTVIPDDIENLTDWAKSNPTDIIIDCQYEKAASPEVNFGLVTDSYMTLTLSKVTKKGFTGTVKSFATFDIDPGKLFDENLASNAVCTKTNTSDEAIMAVENGKCDACYVYTYMAEKYINSSPKSDLQLSTLRTPVFNEYIYVSPESDHELCSILNKCIKADNSGVFDEYVKKYTTVKRDLSLYEYLKLNPEILLSAAVVILLIIVIVAINMNRIRITSLKNKQLEQDLLQQGKLEESLIFTNFFLSTYVSAYYVDFATGLCQVYKRSEIMAKEFPAEKGYLPAITDYINRRVHPDDRELMLSIVEPEKMKELLSDHSEYNQIFRFMSGDEVRNCRMQVIRGADDNHAAFGFIDVTEELIEQQKRFLGAVPLSSDVLNKANIGLWSFELDEGKAPRMYVNDVMLGLIGLDHQVSPEETYHAWYDHIDENSYDLVHEAVDKMSSGIHSEVQYPWHHPDGRTIIVRCGGVSNNEYKNGIRIEGTHQNVTAVLHYDEEEQKKKRENLAYILMSALSGSYASLYYMSPDTGEYQLITRDNVFKEKVDVYMTHGGSFYEDSINSDNVLYEEDREKMSIFHSKETIEKAFGDGDEFTMEYRLLIDGAPVWHRIKAVKIVSEENEVRYALGVTNIQSALEQEERLKKNREIIEILASEYSSVYYIDLTTDELDTYTMNAETESEFGNIFRSGIRYSDAFKMYVDTLVYSEDKQTMLEAGSISNILDELSDKKTFSTTYRSDNNGNPRYCEMKFVKVGDDENPTAVALGFADKDDEIRDEKERKKREDEYKKMLEEANKSKTDFLFNMSHDIRTPMNAIIGFTELAKKHIDDNERVVDSLNKIELSGNHLLELINEVLDMSRVEAGKIKSEMKQVNIHDEAVKLVTICKENAQQHDIKLTYENISIVHEDVIADELHINQIVMNILGNAVKYTPAGGSILLTSEEIESNVAGYGNYRFTVKDTGIGMSPEFLEHIFDSFSREEKASTSEIQGTGLGMTIVKRLVDYLDGTIDIQSEQGKGTTVTITFYLQLADGASEKKIVEEVKDVNLDGKLVLLVDDNGLNREIANDILSEQGIIVEEAKSGADAIEQVKANGAEHYDFILMDIQMPFMNGYETTAEIRKLPGFDKVPIIALSANAFEEDRNKSIEAGMNDHVSKPINVKQLMGVLAKFV